MNAREIENDRLAILNAEYEANLEAEAKLADEVQDEIWEHSSAYAALCDEELAKALDAAEMAEACGDCGAPIILAEAHQCPYDQPEVYGVDWNF